MQGPTQTKENGGIRACGLITRQRRDESYEIRPDKRTQIKKPWKAGQLGCLGFERWILLVARSKQYGLPPHFHCQEKRVSSQCWIIIWKWTIRLLLIYLYSSKGTSSAAFRVGIKTRTWHIHLRNKYSEFHSGMRVRGVRALIFSRLTRVILTVPECACRSFVVCILKPFCTSHSLCCRRLMRRLFGRSDGFKLKACPDAGSVIHSRNSIIPFLALLPAARLQRTEKRPLYFQGLPTLPNNVLPSSYLTRGAPRLFFSLSFVTWKAPQSRWLRRSAELPLSAL